MSLIEDIKHMLNASPDVSAVMWTAEDHDDLATLAGGLFAGICGCEQVGAVVARVYSENPILVKQTTYDITEAARRNFEPGGPAATFLFARGAHAVMAHRVANQLWKDGNTTLALAMKSTCGRALSTDMHPAADIGAGLWLDHGLGFVVGETAVIEEDVSVWHNVTLGSTLTHDGPSRHPRIGRGAVIGAGALILGDIVVGAGANVAAGAIVVEDVPAGAVAVGSKARVNGAARISYTPMPGDGP